MSNEKVNQIAYIVYPSKDEAYWIEAVQSHNNVALPIDGCSIASADEGISILRNQVEALAKVTDSNWNKLPKNPKHSIRISASFSTDGDYSVVAYNTPLRQIEVNPDTQQDYRIDKIILADTFQSANFEARACISAIACNCIQTCSTRIARDFLDGADEIVDWLQALYVDSVNTPWSYTWELAGNYDGTVISVTYEPLGE